jgi:hypothetical protein
MRRALLLLVGVLAATSCSSARLAREIGIHALHPPSSLVCKDGRPVRVIVAEACDGGICGWSCAPDRW